MIIIEKRLQAIAHNYTFYNRIWYDLLSINKMKNLAKLFLPLCIHLSFFTSSALAQGQITVEKENGDIDVFSDVEIFDTQDIIYLQVKESDRILMITKNKCAQEAELLA